MTWGNVRKKARHVRKRVLGIDMIMAGGTGAGNTRTALRPNSVHTGRSPGDMMPWVHHAAHSGTTTNGPAAAQGDH